ncbi:rod shape-determining protein RodA [Pelobacter seleniigenes]|uniref:rod shape-determining protein RodA n=1 Tax=Pelobacter seleniigenes TaxID=407188 RepID=UPI0004A77BBD|nr:rod shape-determining protein RodA [Pelobacter seleniigenes]
MFDRRLVTSFDWILLLTVLALAGIGIVNLYSATASWPEVSTPLYLKQAIWLCGGLLISLSLCLFDYRHLQYFSVHFYVLSVCLLIFVEAMGRTSMGATRWIHLGFFNLQPSEVIKIAIILLLAKILAQTATPLGFGLFELWKPALWILVPVVLILKQPDLGTATIVVFIAGTMLLFAGLRKGAVISLGILGVLASVGGWFGLHDYQRARIRTFLNPEADPLGTGYHIIQSKIAVGSGGFFGKGFIQGSQSQLSFLPERHTDFAFSVFAEEWGFIGSVSLLVLYLFLVVWGLYIARRANDRFGLFLAVGVTAMNFWHIVVNLGMVIGLLPVVGVPLPLFSYGGTSMVTTMIGIGLLMNVSMRRFMF